MIFSNIKIHRI